MIVRNLLLAIGSLPGNRTYMHMLVAVIEFEASRQGKVRLPSAKKLLTNWVISKV